MLFSRKIALLAAVLVLSLSLAACDQFKPKDKDKAEAAAPPPPSVTVAKPLVQPVDDWRTFSGRFEATDTVDIRSRVSGYLTQILFKEGAIVKKGDPLFVIDPRPFEAALRQKQADRALAASKVAAAQNDYNRALELFKTGDVAQALLDNRKAVSDSAKAAVASAQAAVDAAALDVTYTKINAPISGRISRNAITVGNLINPGQDVLTTIVSIDPIYFYFDVDEATYLVYSRAVSSQSSAPADHNGGLPVMIALADEKDYSHTGNVDFIDNQMNAGTGTMRGRAVLQNANMMLTPGLFGRVRIRTGTMPSGVLVPDSAVMVDQSRKLVFVVGDNNMVESRTVETGELDKGLRVILKGLDGSERIVINGLQRAHEGAPVTPEEGTVTPTAPGAPAPVTNASASQEAAPADAGAPPAAAPAPAPEEVKPADAKPADAAAATPAPAETKPADAAPADAKPADGTKE